MDADKEQMAKQHKAFVTDDTEAQKLLDDLDALLESEDDEPGDDDDNPEDIYDHEDVVGEAGAVEMQEIKPPPEHGLDEFPGGAGDPEGHAYDRAMAEAADEAEGKMEETGATETLRGDYGMAEAGEDATEMTSLLRKVVPLGRDSGIKPFPAESMAVKGNG